MGVRHYSPELGQFTTPDLLFMQNPTLCLENPVGCNLYSYGRNNPLSFTDPTGLCARGGCGTGQYLRYTVRPLERAYQRLAKAMNTTATGVSKIYSSLSIVGGGVLANVKASTPNEVLAAQIGVNLGYGSKGLTAMLESSGQLSKLGTTVGLKNAIGAKYGKASFSAQKFTRVGKLNTFLEYDGISANELPISSIQVEKTLGGQVSLGDIFVNFKLDYSKSEFSAGVGYERLRFFDAVGYADFNIENKGMFKSGFNQISHSIESYNSAGDLWSDKHYLE